MKIEDIPEARGVSEVVPMEAFSREALERFMVALLSAQGQLVSEIGIGPMESTGELAIVLEIKEGNIKTAVSVATAMSMAVFLESFPMRRANEFAKALRHVLRHGAS